MPATASVLECFLSVGLTGGHNKPFACLVALSVLPA